MILPYLKYRFDQIMARGMHAQLLLLVAICLALVLASSAVLLLLGAHLAYDGRPVNSVPELVWISFLHTIDPSLVAGSTGNWAASFIFLAITVSGLCTIGALIGIITAGIEDKMSELRKGRSRVLERDHVVILGWDARVPEIVSGLAIAHEAVGGKFSRAKIAVLADRDPDQTKEDLEDVDLLSSSLIIRRGSPLDQEDLHIVSACSGQAIIIPAPIARHGDAQVIKTLLALNNFMSGCLSHVVAEVTDRESFDLARSLSADVHLICADDIVSKIIGQSVLSPGLTEVFQSLLHFRGSEFYSFPVKDSHLATGVMTFGELLLSCPAQVPVGLVDRSGTLSLPAAWDAAIEPGMSVITLAEDDAGLQVSRKRNMKVPEPVEPEIMGRPEGINVLIYTEQNQELPYLERYLEEHGAIVEVRPYPACIYEEQIDHDTVILLSNNELEPQASDAIVMTKLLKLRNRRLKANVVAEILDPDNIDLMWTARADDCIASYHLSACVLSQAAYHPELLRVIQRLLDEDGVRLGISPVSDYMEQGTFQYLTLQAMARGEIALGYFPDDISSPALNPSKGTTVPVKDAKAILLQPQKT